MPAADITAVRTNRAVITMICRRLRASLSANAAGARRRSGLQERQGLCLLQGGAAVRTQVRRCFSTRQRSARTQPLGIQREKVRTMLHS